jgi:hypothetical protein
VAMHFCRTRVTWLRRWNFEEQLPVAASFLILFVYQQLFWCMCEPDAYVNLKLDAILKHVWTETWFCRDDICSVKPDAILMYEKSSSVWTETWCKICRVWKSFRKNSDNRDRSAHFQLKKDLEHIWTKLDVVKIYLEFEIYYM